MANKVRLNKNIGGVKTQLYPETSIPQVVGLVVALAAKDTALADHVDDTNNPHDVTASQVGTWTVAQIQEAIAEASIKSEAIKAPDVSDQANWNKEDTYYVGNDTDGYVVWVYLYDDDTLTSGVWASVGAAGDVNLSEYYTKTEIDTTLEDYLTSDDAANTYATLEDMAGVAKIYYDTDEPENWADGDYWVEDLGAA